MYRFLACIWNAGDRDGASRAASIAARLRSSSSAWRTVIDTPGMTVLCIGSDGPAWQAYRLAAQGGVVLGALFQSGSDGVSRACAPGFDEPESRAIVQSGGERLVRGYWGRYVAFLRDSLSQRQFVLRDPTALFPCYAARIQSVDVYFSWLADAAQVGVSTTGIDLEFARAQLKSRLAYGWRTGLTNVSQVLGGECVTHDRGTTTRALLWNPLQECEPPIEDSAHAAAELRRVTRDVVQAWAGRYPAIVHALSGGLDSSIVLACLQGASAPISCFNAFTSGAGDERVLARLAAEKAGYELVEQHRTGAEVKLEALLDAPLCPAPIDCIAWLAHVQHDATVAHERGAGAFFTGSGGDEIFGRTGATWAISDLVRRHGIRPSLFAKAMHAARQEQKSVWTVLHAALWGVRWNPQSEPGVSLSPDAASASRENSDDHPALRDAVLPAACGKRRHAFLLAPLPHGFLDPVTAPVVERLMPLRSQPLLELSLRVPTYMLIADGWDRALARRAFSSELPVEVLSRRTKGEVSEYMLNVLDNNLPFLRGLLMQGRLVEEGLVDRTQLATILKTARSRDRGLIAQLCDFMDVEVWLRSCLAINSQQSTQT